MVSMQVLLLFLIFVTLITAFPFNNDDLFEQDSFHTTTYREERSSYHYYGRFKMEISYIKISDIPARKLKKAIGDCMKCLKTRNHKKLRLRFKRDPWDDFIAQCEVSVISDGPIWECGFTA
uniref:Uncharacterized protein n=1 Tax=Acrobeloides nanus TaxID=290746 RepID=A0A914CVF6_9BILA